MIALLFRLLFLLGANAGLILLSACFKIAYIADAWFVGVLVVVGLAGGLTGLNLLTPVIAVLATMRLRMLSCAEVAFVLNFGFLILADCLLPPFRMDGVNSLVGLSLVTTGINLALLVWYRRTLFRHEATHFAAPLLP